MLKQRHGDNISDVKRRCYSYNLGVELVKKTTEGVEGLYGASLYSKVSTPPYCCVALLDVHL